MSLFTEACKDHVRNLKKDENNDQQKKFQNTFVLREAIEKQKKALENERDTDKRILVPKQLILFIDTDVYYRFLNSLLEYCSELFRLENKQQVLEQEAKARNLPVPKVLPSEKKKLNEKAKVMANSYSWIVFYNKSISDKQMGQCHSFMQFKSKILSNQKQDKSFYESLFLFSVKCLKDAFDTNDLTKLEEEVSRLFRSNAFNITERKIMREDRERQYPMLKQTVLNDKKEYIDHMHQKLRVPREPHRPVFNRTKSEIRPLYNRLTPHGAVLTRSPMVSLIFPSLKDKIKMFQDESKKKGQNRVNSSMFVKRQELENIVEQEKKKRNVTDNWMA